VSMGAILGLILALLLDKLRGPGSFHRPSKGVSNLLDFFRKP
jgi:hypothetical protein